MRSNKREDEVNHADEDLETYRSTHGDFKVIADVEYPSALDERLRREQAKAVFACSRLRH
jgi:hypothetical protein